MGSRNVWVLLVVVLALVGVALWQLDREKSGEFAADRPLFDGLRAERITRVRLDHLEQSLQLEIERDANGTYQIVDPLVVPADAGVLERLFEAVTRNRAQDVERGDLKGLSLDPPRALLVLTEETAGGERELRLELGALDVDGKHVFARVEGRVVRTLMNLDSTLDRDLAGWRQRRILNVDPASVVEVRRSGQVLLDEASPRVDMTFEAGTTESGWRATRPWNAQLDPAAIHALLSNACYLDARTFVADSAAQIGAFGMDQPDLRLELGIDGGFEEALLFRQQAGADTWLCMREGSTHLVRVDQIHVLFLTVPTDGYFDPNVARLVREEVQRIELRRGEETVGLRRDGKLWRVSSTALPGNEWVADGAVVGDLMGRMESAKVASFLVEGTGAPFVAGPRLLELSWTSSSGGGAARFGAEAALREGVVGRQYQRVGDDIVGVVESALPVFVDRPLEDFFDRQLVQLPERGITRIEIRRGEFERSFVRDAKTGVWSPRGLTEEAPKEFLKCIERLLSLRADRVLPASTDASLRSAFEITLVDGGEVHTRYRVGLESGGDGVVFEDGTRRARIDGTGLYADLEAIR